MQGGALVDAANHIVKPGIQRKLDQADLIGRGQGLALAIFPGAIRADGIQAADLDVLGRTPIKAGAALHLWQKSKHAADGRCLGRTARTDQKDAADIRVN